MAKRKKKSLIDKAFGNDVDETDDSEMDASADEASTESQVLDQEQVSNVLDEAEVKASPDVKPAGASIQKEKKPKASKVRGKDMKFKN